VPRKKFGEPMERNLRPKTDKDFGAPPPGYIPGIGRGAVGFASGVSRDRPTKIEPEKETDLTDTNYDAFAGYSGSLFDNGQGDAEDVEADQIYDLVESRMESRRKKARDERMLKEAMQAREQRPNMQQQFAEYKQQLASISEEDWMKIPEAQERLKAKRVTKESLLTAPDRILAGSTTDSSGLHEVGLAKKAVLELSLDKTEDPASTGPLNASDYLAQMDGGANTFAGDIAEVKKARLLFKSITRSDPTNATGWLAAARLEEVVGNIPEAKGVLARGITNCPTSEDLWMNAIRLETDTAKAKSIVANGIRQNPKSVLLWTEAARLEELDANKIRVLQKSLEINKNSHQLWKTLVNLVSSTGSTADVLVLLGRAVQCCPDTEELWLTYAKLSDYTAAQKILNDARRHIPTSVAIWMAAAELAAAMGATNLDPILEKAVSSLKTNGVVFDKTNWLEEALKIKSQTVSDSLIRITVKSFIQSSSLSAKEIKHEIFSDFDSLVNRSESVGRKILETCAKETILRERKGVWRKWLEFELSSNPRNEMIGNIFESAVSACPKAEILWLMYAKYLFALLKDGDRAKQVLNRAMDNVPESEQIYLAAVKVAEKTDREMARQILTHAREVCSDSVRVWMRSAQIERWDRQLERCISLIEGGLSVLKPPSVCWKLFLIATHACIESGHFDKAEKWIERAIDVCPGKGAVWSVAADVAIANNNLNKARSILERGRIRLANDEILWWKGYVVEVLAGGSSSSGSRVFLSRALQACPTSGLLWAYAIDHEPVVTRHPKCLDALKKCENDPLVVIGVARFFWLEKKQIDKARKWFQNATRMDKKCGQVWSDSLAFEISQGDENFFNFKIVLDEIKMLDLVETNKGIEWNVFRKRVDNWGKEIAQLVGEYSRERFPGIWENVSPRIASELAI